MNIGRRLDKIDTSLSPKQATLLWLAEARKHCSSYEEYLRLMAGKPLSELPRQKLPRRAAEAMRISVFCKSWNKEAKEHAIREAAMQTEILVLLIITINDWLLEESERSDLLLWGLTEQRWRLWQQRHELKLSTAAEHTSWRQVLMAHISRLQTLKAAIAVISTAHFNGRNLLFTKDQVELDRQIEEAELLAEMYNRTDKAKSWPVIPLECAPDPAKVRRLACQLEDAAKAKAIIEYGEGRAATMLIQRHIR